ncbi:MAG: SBBP repeat-containing protein, partial [Cyanobacteria bacterium J06649_11]
MEDDQQTKSISVVAMEEGSVTTKTKPKVTVDWAKNFGGEFNDEGFGVDVDKQGNIYVTGSFADSADFGDDISVNSEKNSIAGFVAKLDRSGKVLWVQKVDSASSDEGFGIDVDEAGNSYVTGNFKFDFTFDAPILPKGNDDLPKVLAETVQDEENTEDTSIVLDNSDTPSEIPITIKSIGSKDVFVAKLDSDGKVKWANNFGGDSLDAGESIAVD